MNLISISVFQDDYIWVLSENNGRCIIADPGGAAPVLTAIEESQWQPEVISLTHHHQDHVGGVKQLREKFPSIVAYGPAETQDEGVTQVVGGGDRLSTLGHDFSILSTPGYTLGRICYYSEPCLFCGDVMFSGGCGGFFEGIAEQIYQSFMKINAPPEETLICCVHGHTLVNMRFALSILPDNGDTNDYYHKVNELRAKK